ncbi:MAG: hypothetical protein J6W24_01090 [Prevotella sp.]|nr:hypothetical protein [Prevotella sp.]
MAGNTVYVQGSYVDVHDNEVVNLSIDKAGEVHVGESVPRRSAMPRELESNRAKGMLAELVRERLLTGDWQPAEEVTEWQLAMIAHKVGEELGMANFWQVFGGLWGKKPENMRSNYNRSLNTEAELKFRKKLARIV